MDKYQKNVVDFMSAAGQTIRNSPQDISEQEKILRVRLLIEEVLELAEASGVDIFMEDEYEMNKRFISMKKLNFSCSKSFDIVGVADALADIDYVNNGAACSYGIDLEPIKDEVQRSNMSKFIDGYRDDVGKWIKGPSYSAANIKDEIEKQIK